MQAPEERNPTHKSHQQWRIADRRQTAADVGDQENKEHHNVASALSPGVHLDHRAHHQHAGAGGSNPAGKQGSDEQKSHIDPWGTRQISLQSNITCHAEQSKQQHDKGQIIINDAFQHLLCRFPRAKEDRERNHEQQRPEHHRMRLMALPPFCFYQRQHSDTKKQSGKRNTIYQRNTLRCPVCRQCCHWKCHEEKGNGFQQRNKLFQDSFLLYESDFYVSMRIALFYVQGKIVARFAKIAIIDILFTGG